MSGLFLILISLLSFAPSAISGQGISSAGECPALLDGEPEVPQNQAAYSHHWFSFQFSGDMVRDLDHKFDGTVEKKMVLFDPLSRQVVPLGYGTHQHQFGPFERYVPVNQVLPGRELELGEMQRQVESYGMLLSRRDDPTFPHEILDTVTGELLLHQITGFRDFNNVGKPDRHGDIIATRVVRHNDVINARELGLPDSQPGDIYKQVVVTYRINIFDRTYQRLGLEDASVTPGRFDESGLHFANQYSGQQTLGQNAESNPGFLNSGGMTKMFFNKGGERIYPPTHTTVVTNGESIENVEIDIINSDFKEGFTHYVAGNPPRRRYGFLGADMRLLTDARFETARPFDSGKAAVRLNGLWGLIDVNGEWIVEPRWEMLSSGEMDRFLVVKYPEREGFFVVDANTFEELYQLDRLVNGQPSALLPHPGTQTDPTYHLVEIKQGMVNLAGGDTYSDGTSVVPVAERTGFSLAQWIPGSRRRNQRKIDFLNRFTFGLLDLEQRKWLVPPRTFSGRSDVMQVTDSDGTLKSFIRAHVTLDRGEIFNGVIDLSTGQWIFGIDMRQQEKMFHLEIEGSSRVSVGGPGMDPLLEYR